MPDIKAVALLSLTLALAAQAANYTCGSCHAKEAASQPHTPMGKALLLPGHDPLFQAKTDLRFNFGKFAYEVTTRGNVTTYSVSDDAHTVALPIKWTFGSGAQTFVLERDGQFFESLVSYYPEIGGLDLTLGDQALRPKTIDEAVGRKLDIREVTDCLGCHSTGSVANRKLDLASLVPGVSCARCHPDAPAHMAAMSHGGGRAASRAAIPEQLGKKSAESVSNFCGQCHRSWETVVRNNWRGAMDVRFQPYRLANSRCFDGTDPRIRCLACHNPHEDLVTDQARYDAKCLVCHSQATGTVADSPSRAKTCPVATSACTTCHMPKVQLPGGHQTFTDHQIRVVKAGEGYPN